METLLQDIRFGFRMLLRNPGFTAVAVLTLALGFGANTAIFSAVDTILLKPLPLHQPDRLLMLWETESALEHAPFAPQDYLDWQARNHTFSGMTLLGWPKNYNLSGAGVPEHATGEGTEANFFSLLGAQPLAGRTFQPGDDRPGANHVAVLSYGFWQRQFGGDRAALGREVRLNGAPYTIVGIMPPAFALPSGTDLWVPLDMTAPAMHVRGNHSYRAIGRLKPGVTVAQARADLSAIARQLEQQFPDTNFKIGAQVVPLHDQLVGRSRALLLVLLGVVGLVLLIGCANVANLLLARASGRRREIAVRQLLGATGGRLARQLLTESALLALVGAGLGLLVAYWALRLLKASPIVPPDLAAPLQLDPVVLAFTLAIALLTGLLFGLAPALQAIHGNPNEDLKSGGRGNSRGGHARLRNLLVIGEIAISLVVLAGAGLLLRSFQQLNTVDVGVQAAQVSTMKLTLADSAYSTTPDKAAFFNRLLDRLHGVPGVESAALTSELPLEGGSNGYVTIDGQPRGRDQGPLVEMSLCSPAYFHTMGIPLLSGRLPTLEDQQQALAAEKTVGPNDPLPDDAVIPAIINHAMAERFWPGKSPLGHRFNKNNVVVGVVGDVREWGLGQAVMPQAYFPIFSMYPHETMSLVVKSPLPAGSIAIAVRQATRTIDPSLAIFRVRSMDEVISESLGTSRFQTVALGIFGSLALLLALVGIYSVMTYAVSQRTQEMGIRMALGASQTDVLRLVLREGGRLTLFGIVAGLAVAPLLTRLLSGLLYDVQPLDPITFGTVAVLLAATSLAATYVPARRATRVDPMVALQAE